MKKILIGLMGLMILMGMSACDKIEPDENGNYIIFAGSTASWTEGDQIDNPIQRAYVEKYTGPKCSNCPLADETLNAAHEQFGDNLVLVSINHPVGQGIPFSGEPDLRTEDGTAWDSYFGINAIPAAYIDRNTATQYQGAMSNIVGDINNALQASAKVALEVTATQSDKIEIAVNMQLLEDYGNQMTLTLAIVEDSLKYKQLMPNGDREDLYVHNHMLRDVITDIWGIDVDCNGTANECRKAIISYRPDIEGMQIANCHIVAFLSDKATRRVINCAQCNIN